MPTDEDVNDASDTIVVGGDYSEDSAEGSDDSFDAYGADENVEEKMQDAPDLVNDDYAKTFESPPANEDQGNTAQPKPEETDVSMASEPMNNSSAPDTLKSGPLSASTPVLSSLPSSAIPQPTNGAAHTSSDSSGDDGHQSTPSPSSNASASPSPTPTPPRRTSSPTSAVAAPEATEGISVSAEEPAQASPSEGGDGEINIEKLVEDITAGAASPPKGSPSTAVPSPASAPAPAPAAAPPAAAPSPVPTHPMPTTTPAVVLSTLTVSPSASLPPKPAVSHHLPSHLPAHPQGHSFQARTPHPQHPAAQRGSYISTGPPGVAGDGFSSLPPPPSSYGAPHGLPAAARPGSHGAWETFLADEKRYTSEGNWERFPEGSRIFIGNLSSERVSKREVYDVFGKFGRLAQISLKNAYGFVQYHTIAEGNTAMQNAQGIEMGGRKIHLEISRTQKKAEKGDRERSPDRRGPRGERGPKPHERFDGREPSWRRDEYRSGRSPSPRRHDYRGSRDGFGPRDREFAAPERRRSRSPPRFGRFGPDSYRTRSPSPPRHAPADELADLPRRYGSDVPDVQFLAHNVFRGLVDWLQKLFRDRGLKTDVMFVKPNFPRDAIVQRQILEGVHGIVEIDHNTQNTGKISIQVFKRPGGSAHVQFDLYQDLDPPIAAELVLREKANSAPPAPAPTASPIYPSSNYPNPYAPDPRHAGYGYSYPQAPTAPPVQAPPAAQIPGFPGTAIGQLDNNALQALLASLQANPAAAGHPSGASLNVPADGGQQAQQVDINALLGNLRNVAANQAAPMPSYGASAAANYGAAPIYPQHGAHAVSSTNGTAGYDTAQHVQSIMEQLKRASH